MAGPSSTWHRAGSAGSPGSVARPGGVSAETPAGSAAGAGSPARASVPTCTTTWYTSGSSAPATLAARNDSATVTRPSARSEEVRTDRGGVRGGRFRGNALVRVLQVSTRGTQRLEQHRALQRGEPERAGQRPVLLEPPYQPTADQRRCVIGLGGLAVGAGEPLQLVGGHRLGQLGQPCLGGRGGDPGQRPHLGIRQPPGGEPGPDHRQVPQRAGHPDMLPGGTRGHLALPRQPLRAAVHLPARPAPAGIEISQQDQEPAGRRGQVTGQLADLRLQPLQRHRAGGAGAGGAGAGGAGAAGGEAVSDGAVNDGAVSDRASEVNIEHVFDVSTLV